MADEEQEHIPQGIEYKRREPKEKKASRVGVHGTAEGMADASGEGGPPA